MAYASKMTEVYFMGIPDERILAEKSASSVARTIRQEIGIWVRRGCSDSVEPCRGALDFKLGTWQIRRVEDAPDMARLVGIKILRDKHQGSPDLIRPFIEEAKVTGQL